MDWTSAIIPAWLSFQIVNSLLNAIEVRESPHATKTRERHAAQDVRNLKVLLGMFFGIYLLSLTGANSAVGSKNLLWLIIGSVVFALGYNRLVHARHTFPAHYHKLAITSFLLGIAGLLSITYILIVPLSEYRQRRAELVEECNAASAAGCYALANLEYTKGSRIATERWMTMSCLLGNSDACVHIITKNTDYDALELRETLFGSQCGRNNFFACSEKAAVLERKGKLSEARELYQLACDNDITSACSDFGNLQKSENIPLAWKNMEKGCAADEFYCSRKNSICSELAEIADETAQKEGMEFCSNQCSGGNQSACNGVRGALRAKANALEAKKQLAAAGKIYEKLCALEQGARCVELDNVCDDLSKTHGDTESLSYCTDRCNKGVAMSCFDVASYYKTIPDPANFIEFNIKGCDALSDSYDCRDFVRDCKWPEKFMLAMPDGLKQKFGDWCRKADPNAAPWTRRGP